MAEETSRALAVLVARLAAATALDRESDPRRTLPEIAPAELWRTYPALLRSAALWHPDVTQRDFMRNLAADIEGRAFAPEIGAGKAV